MEIAIAGIGVLGTLLGVWGGWLLSLRTSREERRWTEKQTVRARQDDAAATLDTAILKAQGEAPALMGPGIELHPALQRAAHLLRGAWSRCTVLTDPEIARRIHALDIALLIATGDAIAADKDQIDPWPLMVGFVDLRRALAAFQDREPLPAADLPTAQEIVALTKPARPGKAMDTLTVELRRRSLS